MASVEEIKLVSTGFENVDNYLTIIFFIVTGILIIDVAYIFWRVYRDSSGSRENSWRISPVRRYLCAPFFFCALAAALIVNVPKFRGLKLISAEEVRETLEELRGYVKSGLSLEELKQHMHGFEERINHLSDLLSNGKTRSLTLEQRIGHLLGTDMNLKWAPNIWDNFKILFATHQRFWWTQQWFMGYMAWAAFVSIQCRQYGLPMSATYSFTFLGYLFGLSTMQFLFYALLLFKPKLARHSLLIPHPFYLMARIVLSASLIQRLETSHREGMENSDLSTFDMLHVLLMMAQCLDRLFLVDAWPFLSMGMQFRRILKLEKALTMSWYISSTIAVAFYLFSSFQVYSDTQTASQRFLSYFGFGKSNIDNAKDSGHSILGALEDHTWVRAVGIDIMLSAFGLCCWILVQNIDAGRIVKCSVFPYLDETEATVGNAIENVRDTTGEIYDYSINTVWNAFSTAIAGGRKVKRRVARLQARIGISDDDVESEYDSWPSATRRRGRSVSGSTTRARSKSATQTRSISTGPARSRSRSQASVSPVKQNTASRKSSRARTMSISHRESGLGYDEGRGTISYLKAWSAKVDAVLLLWGLLFIGGLGMASTAVFGADLVY